ncbi:hypothetical protein [Streptomyces uncialis]|uniref:hypothetical protein n=1 Tax=Streptomyces uncialis TaxID=1048205 RepID=UPI00224FCFAA|nr:hypothetical protein [Streptomyces uncialis]MCX4661481.1 hypothetical protein [Streptomyces uncialis]
MRPHGQRVRYPWRIVEDPAYADVDLAVYGKVAALAARPKGCTAKVVVLAQYCGISVSAAERALRRLTSRTGRDGWVEITTRRRTHRVTGTGESAQRRTRVLDRGERYVWAPVLAAETLRPRLHRLYLAIRYALTRGLPVTLTDLALVLRHHTGRHAGQPLGTDSVSVLVAELEATGWLTVHRRTGYRGRHTYEVHDHPLHEAPAPSTPRPDDGSAPRPGDGSLASKEDLELTDVEKGPEGGDRRRRTTGSKPVENPAVFHRPSGYSGRVWPVLEPVRDLLPALGTWPTARLDAEIRRLLTTGATTRQLHHRLSTHRRTVLTADIADPARWLLGVALTPARSRHHCDRADCEGGLTWPAGTPCQVCAEPPVRRTTRPAPEPPPAPAPAPRGPRPVWHTCTTCQAPSRTPLTAGQCQPCHQQPEPQPTDQPTSAAAAATGARRATQAGLDQDCPDCHAPPGHRCHTARGRPRAPHTTRTTTAA